MKPEISVCVCAFRRPTDLRRLLESLIAQVASTPAFEVVVVDNDAAQSSAEVVREFVDARVPVRYFVEPEQNIARARNRSLAEARADLVATIDDDEFADPAWLQELHGTLETFHADAVFGPVHARFTEAPPRWVVDGCFFDYKVIPSGEPMPLDSTRTSNALVKRSAFPDDGNVFDEKLGLTGGSDTDLFRRMQISGACMLAAEYAVVFESVPAERVTLKWLAARWFRYGTQRLSVLEKRQRGFRHTAGAIWTAMRGLASNAWGALRHALRHPGTSSIHLVHSCYWIGVIAGAAGVRYREYRLP